MSERYGKYGGTEYRKKDLEEGVIPHIPYKLKAKYSWSAGAALGRFLRELKNGKIIGRKCLKCGRVMVPPRMFCEQCFRPTDEWVYVSDTGRVITFSISYVGTDARRLKEPELPAVIELDGASEGMGILHKLGEVKPEDVKIGMRVKAVWKPPEEREGAITDILYFKPVD